MSKHGRRGPAGYVDYSKPDSEECVPLQARACECPTPLSDDAYSCLYCGRPIARREAA